MPRLYNARGLFRPRRPASSADLGFTCDGIVKAKRSSPVKMGVAGLAPRAGYNVIAIDLALARRLALSVVLGQAAVTLICALAAWLIADSHAALSAVLGGGISTVASLAMALLGFGGRSAADPQRAVRTFFVGETAKIAVMIVLFVAVLKTMKVVPLAMLGAYVATFIVFWVALANALPPLGGGVKRRADTDS
jgi:F0F1-type ATP synthase assembly protein I